MAQSERINPISVPASADLSASQFCFMTINTSGQLALPGAGADALGVLQDKPNAAGRAGELALLRGSGRLKVIAAGTITALDKVKTDAAGKALTATTGTHVLGTALQSAVAGDLFEIQPGSNMLLP